MAMASEVLEVAELVRKASGRTLLVGGCVRDRLLGIAPKDFDVECFGIPPDRLRQTLASRFSLDLVGVSFGVLKLHGADVDVAIPRRETKLGLGHRAFEMEYDPTLTVRVNRGSGEYVAVSMSLYSVADPLMFFSRSSCARSDRGGNLRRAGG